MITRQKLIKAILSVDSIFFAKNLHRLIRFVGSRSFIDKIFVDSCRKKLGDIQQLHRVMVIPDVNLGDAVIGQLAAEILKYHFPECEIDFFCTKNVLPLLAHNPYIFNIHTFDPNGNMPTESVRSSVNHHLKTTPYDLIICLSPFFTEKDFNGLNTPVIDSSQLILNVLHSRFNGGTGSLVYNLAEFVDGFVKYLPQRLRPDHKRYPFSGHKIFLPDSVFEQRRKFAKKKQISDHHTIVFFNPDTSDKYTFIDPRLQVRILSSLVQNKRIDFVLLGSGHTHRGIQDYLMSRVPHSKISKIIRISRFMPLDLYAAILDLADLFLTGDTGPMHIAAAWKQTGNGHPALKNSTSLVTLFGSTDANIYGYDSYGQRYMESPQRAPSKIFDSPCPQKNILCTLEKIGHRCRRNDCFKAIQADQVSQWVNHYLKIPVDGEMNAVH